MTNKFNYTTRIVVVIAILSLLLGLILGGVFNIVYDFNNDFDDDNHMKISDSAYGYKVTGGPVLLSEIDYSKSCSGSKSKPKPIPWKIEYEVGGIMSPL